MTQSAKILLIDDDPTQLAILTAYLSSRRILDIHEARDGESARRLIEANEQPFTMIITDLSMPNLDGFEFLKVLGQMKYQGEVVIISGHENILLESAASLGKMHGLTISGQIRKPLTKFALDRLFSQPPGKQPTKFHNNPNSMAVEEIIRGLSHNEFFPYYQPKIDLLSGKIVGAEALARWAHKEHGLISPAAFIPVAEANDLISEITMSIFAQVISDLEKGGAAWNGMKLSFNLPARMVSDINLPDLLSSKLARKGLSNSALCIEITESGMVEFDPVTIEVLSRLRIKGFDLSIDDFGTGAANIANLKVFPYNELKIDQSFINNVLTDAFSAETVRTSITLARQLGLRIVAEGIENDEVLQFVKSKGIDQAQGYLFSKPVPVKEMTALFENPLGWLANNRANANSNAA